MEESSRSPHRSSIAAAGVNVFPIQRGSEVLAQPDDNFKALHFAIVTQVQEKLMPASEPSLRQQIDDAMEKIRHQLEVLNEGPTIGGPSNDRSVIVDLEAEYQALKDARAKLGPHDR